MYRDLKISVIAAILSSTVMVSGAQASFFSLPGALKTQFQAITETHVEHSVIEDDGATACFASQRADQWITIEWPSDFQLVSKPEGAEIS